jgi:hypothetical protein
VRKSANRARPSQEADLADDCIYLGAATQTCGCFGDEAGASWVPVTMGGVGYPAPTRASSLLSEICTERGWCLPPGSDERVRAAIPDGVASIVDLLIRIELEIAPEMCESPTRRWLTQKVEDWLFDPRGHGASSGLPI